MENESCKFSYNEIDDSLIVSCKKDDENVKERFNLGNFIFNLTGRGKIVGIQILNASEVLTDYNLNSNILSELKNVNLNITKKEGLLGVALILTFQNQQGKISIPLMNLNHPIIK
ncbi:hypothetical protein COU53_00635 [Candidatus Pacearchaeota archaeon CG10_big_fil_rev_8_21_14_0_10_30_48]|nr:MAG: hypothetical protein COU53_00635 [Candidatus Pacearchaeota archaeon CG10_big_fil_rev_8_21_14_0_10_30_48]